MTGPADADLTVTVSGTRCVTDDSTPVDVRASLAGTEEADEFVDREPVHPGPDGTWTARLTIPAGPAATYLVDASCWIDELTGFLDPATQVVTTSGRPTAPPARPVPARPTFTG